MDYLATQILAAIKADPEWAMVMIGLTAFGESFVFLSLLFPGTAILVAAGTLVSAGILDPISIMIAGIVGAILGDSVSFWLGQKFGPVLPQSWPFRNHPELLTRGTVFFERYGGSSVFIGRFFGPLRAVVPVAAGMMQMSTPRFYTVNILSAVVWAPALVLSGALLARSLSGTESMATKILYIALIAAGMTALAYCVRRRILMP